MKVWIPDSLMEYERSILRELLQTRGHMALFSTNRNDAEAILTGGPPLSATKLVGQGPVHIVIRYARGRYDLSGEEALLSAAGIAYHCICGTSAASTAEHALMFMLALLRRLPQAQHSLREGRWAQREIAEMGIRDLKDVTVGLIGLGRVGCHLARLLGVFGPQVFYWQHRRLPTAEEERLGLEWSNLEELFARADVISLQARNSAEGGPLFTRQRLSLLRPNSVIINTGDGRHIDLEALREAILEGRLSAGLDVFPEEPFIADRALAVHPSLLMTPHVAGRSRGTAQEMFRRACTELDTFQSEDTWSLAPPPDSANSVSEIGPVVRHVLRSLGSERPLANCPVSLTRRITARLPSLHPALAKLGAPFYERVDDDSDLILLTSSAGIHQIGVDLASGSCGREGKEAFSIAKIPAVRQVIERWQLDYQLWQDLLPRRASGSLPGCRLIVEGYGRRGRLIAWRARELGLQVQVAEKHLRPRFEALSDGFETQCNASQSNELVVRTRQTIEARETPFTVLPAMIHGGVTDELTAAVIITIYVLRQRMSYPAQETTWKDLAAICDRLLLEALISARDPNFMPSRFLWSPDCW